MLCVGMHTSVNITAWLRLSSNGDVPYGFSRRTMGTRSKRVAEDYLVPMLCVGMHTAVNVTAWLKLFLIGKYRMGSHGGPWEPEVRRLR